MSHRFCVLIFQKVHLYMPLKGVKLWQLFLDNIHLTLGDGVSLLGRFAVEDVECRVASRTVCHSEETELST